jgi:acyl-CoA reductase-like NAD-dependent aldehyde dehydrogenase
MHNIFILVSIKHSPYARKILISDPAQLLLVGFMSDIWKPIKSGSPPTYRMHINGKWVKASGSGTFDVRDPANNSLVGRVPAALKKDADAAIKAAYKSRPAIANMPTIERIELLDKISELVKTHSRDLVKIISREAGKPVHYAEGEVKATAGRLHLAAEEARKFSSEFIPGDLVPGTAHRMAMVARKPLGVVLAISPFNYPLFISISKVAPALASGNAVVLKAASDDPICMLMFARLAELAGLPKGVLNVITGSGREIGDFIASHPMVNMISFTGSSSVGKRITQKAGMKKLHLELGGKGPALVFSDADLELAAKECLTGALKYSGQRCDALSRILVEQRIADRFARLLVKGTKSWKIGPTTSPKTMIGPLINKSALDKVDSLVKDAKQKGAEVLMGGKPLKGLYYAPTVLDRVTPDMRIAWEETFGPVVTIIRFKNQQEAISLANKSIYGLDASVFTQDIDKAIKTARALEDGTVTINGHPAHGLGNFPFGGDKDSGLGREGIGHSIEEMTKLDTIVISLKK